MFALREAFRSMQRSPISAFVIALVIGVGVGLTAVFGFVAYSAHTSLLAIERSIAIDIYFEASLESDQAQMLYDSYIATDRELTDTRFISKEDALQEYEAGTGQDVRSVLGDNPLPASASVKLREPSIEKLEQKIAMLRAQQGVAEVVADRELGKTLAHKARLLDQLTMWLGILIGALILIVVAVSTRLTVEIRKQTLSVMRLLGASGWKVNAPFILEGAIAGAIGGLIAFGVLVALDELALRTLMPDLLGGLASDRMLAIGGIILVTSAVLGTLGSAVSVFVGGRK